MSLMSLMSFLSFHLIGTYIFLCLTYFVRGLAGLKPKALDFFEAFIWEIIVFGIIGGIVRVILLKIKEQK